MGSWAGHLDCLLITALLLPGRWHPQAGPEGVQEGLSPRRPLEFRGDPSYLRSSWLHWCGHLQPLALLVGRAAPRVLCKSGFALLSGCECWAARVWF